MQNELDPNRRGSGRNRTIITLVLGAFAVAVLAIGLWGGAETSSIESVPDEANMSVPGEGSIENNPTGATARPENAVTDEVAPSNNPVATE
ncbi:hypothetical protein [Chthonobacter rhizosphaerae]|uniref:hypothetical protein n=1 Tax=Chthonobacter rhizosphaerae TaxID=2735553 RepID=UPI0015EF75CA|nr:hypothetical protein [Chthonobacter rhizosphaerae]